jgi:hypothetical protein
MLIVVVLGAAAWLGLTEGLEELQEAESPGQQVAASFQLLYGAAALVSVITLFARPSWTVWALVVWSVALTVTGTMAPVVWGGADWRVGVLAGVVTLSIAALVAWGAVAHLRNRAGR